MAGGVLAVAALPIAAGAQTNVPSFLALSVTQPNGFGSFPKRTGVHTYTLNIAAQVTATDSPLTMSIGDGDDTGGARHGHLVSGSSVLAAPLQVATGGSTWQGLDAATDPQLVRWSRAVTQAPATIRLRQQVGPSGPRSGYHKLLLLTVSANTP